jgi:acyl carrier protein
MDLPMLRRLIDAASEGRTAGIPVGPDTRLVEDLNLKSLQLLTLVYLCEKELSADFTQNADALGKLATVTTAGQLLDVLGALAGPQLA